MAWHSAVNNIPRCHNYDENSINRRSDVVFREDEFRTPSPLLPLWHQSQPFNSAATYEVSSDDCYFYSSENLVSSYLREPDIKSVNCRQDSDSFSRSQTIALDAVDNCHLRRKNTELADSCGNRFTITDGTLDENTRRESKLLNSQRFVVDRRST